MKNAYRQYLAKKLKALREERLYTREEVAAKIGKQLPAYRAYEEGRSEPSLLTVELLAMLYSTSIDAILYDSPAKKVTHLQSARQ